MLRLSATVSTCLGLVLATLFSGSATAQAQTRGGQERAEVREFSVHVLAPPSCVDSKRFAELVAQRTKRAAATAPQAEIHFAVSINVAMDGASGRITTIRAGQSDPGKSDAVRVVRAATCAEAADALALIAAVILDPKAALDEKTAAAPATPVAQPIPPPPARPAPSPGSDWRLGPGIAALFTGGVGPGVSTGFNAFFGVSEIQKTGLFALDARVSFAMTQTSTVTTSAGVADFDWWSAGLTICPIRFPPEIFRSVFAIEPCAGFEGGLLRGHGRNTTAPSTSTGTWLAASVGLRAAWSLGDSFRVELEGDLVIPIGRDRFFFAPDLTAYKVPVVTGRGTVGFALLF